MARKHESGATVNGRKPVPKMTVHDYAQNGHAERKRPEESQIEGAGAKKHEVASPGVNLPNKVGEKTSGDLNGPKAAGERISSGTTKEEQKKRLAAQMYPSSRGLREYGAGGTL